MYGDLMVIYGDLMGFMGIYRGYDGIYHLVMTNSNSHGKIHPFLRTVNHLFLWVIFHGYVK